MLSTKKLKTLSLLLVLPAIINAQNSSSTENLDIKIESSGVFSDGDFAPFWLTNNNYGIASPESNKEYIRTGIFGGKKIFGNEVDLSFGFDVVAAHNLQSDIFVQQAYADFKRKILFLSIGMKERNNPLKNKMLSTGGLTLSNNARPIPQVEAGFRDFVEIPGTNGWLHVQGAVSYGWFTDNKFKKRYAGDGNYNQKLLYHRKYAYLKLDKKPSWDFIIGMEMDTQWGGHVYRNGEFVHNSPAKIEDFFKIFIPMAGGSNANATDKVNIQGNVYGSWHFIFNYKKKDYSLKAYHEHFFEDHSGLIFKNIPDGIYGLEFNLNKKQAISSVVLEYIHTKSQSGPFLWDTTPEIPVQVSAGDDYYNQVDYVSVANYGYVMGNPLLTSPIYNDEKTLFLLHNRISAFHLGLGGYINNDLRYRTLLSYSKSWGTYVRPARNIRTQFSSLFEAIYSPAKLNGWEFSTTLAFDNSATMVGDNAGFQLKISKLFHIK